MEIILKTKKREECKIARDKAKGGGIIRIDEEACVLLEGVANSLHGSFSIKELASVFIKESINNSIIREEIE